MAGIQIFLGGLDLTGWLIIGLIVFGSLGGLSLVIAFILVKVFRSRKENLTAINLGRSSSAETRGVEVTRKA